MNISNLNLSLYLLVLIKVTIEIIKKLNEKNIIIKSLENVKENVSKTVDNKIIIRYNRINHPISLSKIIYIESLADYLKIVTENDDIVTKEKISKILDRLPNTFIRTHRSFIINAQKVNSYNKAFATLDSHQIPISRTYKKDVLNYLENGKMD